LLAAVTFCHGTRENWHLSGFGPDPKLAYSVIVGGHEVGLVKSEQYLDDMLSILAPSCRSCGEMSSVRDWIVLEPAKVNGNVFRMHGALRQTLEEFLQSHVNAFSIVIADQPVITLASPDDANRVMTEVISRFTPEPGPRMQIRDLVVEPLETVQILPSVVSRLQVISPDEGARYLLNGTTERKSYRVTK
jgi:hypothetical protein